MRGLLTVFSLLFCVATAPADNEARATLKGHKDTLDAVAFSPDGKQLATGGADDNVMIWDAMSGELLATLKGHEDSVLGVAFSPDGKSLASASADNTVRVWNLANRKI